ncbi:MAG: response regulator [Bacillota bacterium]
MAFKVLVVDDEKDLRDLISYFLSREKFEVATAENGCDAIEKLKSWHPQLIISDIRMPQCDGFELIQNISQIPHNAPAVMFISGYVGGDEEELKKNPHCVGFIAKPVNKTELISLVKKVEASENRNASP